MLATLQRAARPRRLGGERRGEEHRTSAREERAAVHHWVGPNVFWGCALYGARGQQIGSMPEPSSQAGWESSKGRPLVRLYRSGGKGRTPWSPERG